MPMTVRLRDAAEYSEAAQKIFELSRVWFGYDFTRPPPDEPRDGVGSGVRGSARAGDEAGDGAR